MALSSGTAALHLALLLAGVGPGDERAGARRSRSRRRANAVIYLGARPVFVDSDPDTWNIDPALVAEELERRRPPRAAAGAR